MSNKVLKRVVKIKIYPSNSQKHRIDYILSSMNFIWNSYLGYINRNGYINYMKYSKKLNKWKNGKDLPDTDDYCQDYTWLKEYNIPTKAISDTLINLDNRFKRFMKHEIGKPRFKSYNKGNGFNSFFFIKDNIHFDKYENNNLISLPILGKMRIQYKDRKKLPYKDLITSGRIIKDNRKYYVIFIYDVLQEDKCVIHNPIGIDLGVKTYITAFIDGEGVYKVKSINNEKIKRYEEKINKLEKIISNKININYYRLLNSYLDNHNSEEPDDKYKNIMKGESYRYNNIRKLYYKIKVLKRKISNIRKDKIKKIICKLTSIFPKYISIEDLSVKDMLSNTIKESKIKDNYIYNKHKLHKYIQDRLFYYFKYLLISKCELMNITIHLVDRYYPSSKTCCMCGDVNKDIKLSDRIFKCVNKECELHKNPIDRDINASLNILNTKKYTLLFN